MKPILEIQNISKKFNINDEAYPYLSLRDSLGKLFKSRKTTTEFWALNNVNFDVMPGDTVGIIGKNGAGKSTLLKILSKITPPTSGKIIGRGRIASLLEVGTGFHSELSGRENIFMNGSILGMRKTEIVKNFDAIVDFSGIEKFIDTPLKHYSSGMQLRLAFAVAAFLENEILIIDEVLAVGDAEFQKKCMGKMEDVSSSGRTVIFVSHNFGAITQLCKRGVYLKDGTVEKIGNINEVLDSYLSSQDNKNSNKYISNNREGIFFQEIETISLNEANVSIYGFNENIVVLFKIKGDSELDRELKISITLLDKFQTRIFTTVKLLNEFSSVKNEIISVKVTIPKQIIAPNVYSFRLAIFNDSGKVYDLVENVCRVKIVDTGTEMTKYEGVDYGSVILNCEWKNA